jgi:hypothetical protein
MCRTYGDGMSSNIYMYLKPDRLIAIATVVKVDKSTRIIKEFYNLNMAGM